jgi:hypothetical protein
MNTLHTTTAPAISCFALPVAEYHRRLDEAEQKEDEKRIQHNQPDGGYGREIMWHHAFPAECVAMLSNMPLYEVGPWLLDCHADSHNDGKPLDLIDYCYLADVLREGLASNPTPLAALRLNRALAWVEQAGTKILVTQSVLAIGDDEPAAPLMVAVAA